MKLYTAHNSNNSRRVLATAEHLGIELEVVVMNTAAGEHKQADYLALNPNGRTPTLVDGEFTLWESHAIMQYLAETAGDNKLWPSDAKARADVSRWQFWEAAHLGSATGTIVFETLVKPMFMKLEPDAAAVEAAVASFHVNAPILDQHLNGRKYIAGDELTLADFSIGASFSYVNLAPHAYPLEKYEHIRSWLRRLDEVPAWSSTAPKMGDS